MRNLVRLAALALALAVLAAGPALAQDVSFEAAGVRYTVVAPKGYCSKGPAIDSYLAEQRRSGQAIPDAVFARCGATSLYPFDFFAMIIVRDGPKMERDTMLAQMRAEMPAALRRDSLLPEAASREMERDVSRALDTSVTIDVGGVKPVGIDEFCGYIAGVVEMTVGGSGKVRIAMLGCATAIGGRVAYLFHYSSDKDGAAAAAGLPALKRFAQAVQAGK